MRGPQRFFVNRQGAPEQRHCLGHLNRVQVKFSEAVQQSRYLQIVWPQRLFGNGERLFVHGFRFGHLALMHSDLRQVA